MSPACASRRRTRVLLVARHFAVRRGLRHLLAACKDFELLGEADDETSALMQLRGRPPDVIVLDGELVEDGGYELVTHLRWQAPSARILLLAAPDDAVLQDLVVRATADGILSKSRADECLAEAIGALYRGEQWREAG